MWSFGNLLAGLECAPPKSCPSEPSSPGQEKSLLDDFSQDSTLPGELPHAPPKSCPSEPPSPDQEKILLDGFSQDSISPSELAHVPKSANFSEQLGDSISTPECVTPCSSMDSDSDKRSLNTKLKVRELGIFCIIFDLIFSLGVYWSAMGCDTDSWYFQTRNPSWTLMLRVSLPWLIRGHLSLQFLMQHTIILIACCLLLDRSGLCPVG